VFFVLYILFSLFKERSMSQEKANREKEQSVAVPEKVFVGDDATAASKMHKNLFGTHSPEEYGMNAKWNTVMRLTFACAFFIVALLLFNPETVPDATPEQLIFMKIVGVILLVPFLGFTFFGVQSLRNARILHNVKRNSMPKFLTDKSEEMVVLSIILAREYNKLRSRWVRYLELCDTGACTCSIDRDQMNTRLAAMKKEIESSMAIANAYTAMVDAGDFDEMPSGNLIADHLEHARDLQESINREVSGVNHAMIAPLHVEARMADAQEEVREAIRTSATCVNPDDEKKRKAQQQAAQRQPY
jgi:hypothetical protein